MPAQPAPARYEADFSDEAITPPVGTSLAGFFHDRVSKRVRDDAGRLTSDAALTMLQELWSETA